MRNARIAFFYCFFVSLIFLLVGCSSGASVSGKVTLDGQPVDGGEIAFIKQLDKGQASTLRGSIEGGNYKAKSDSFVSGEYLVVISWNKKTGKKVKSNDLPDMVDETIQAIPKKYNTESSSKVDLTGGNNTKNFDLQSK